MTIITQGIILLYSLSGNITYILRVNSVSIRKGHRDGTANSMEI